MILEQVPVGKMRNFAYIGGNRETRDGFLVDPGFDGEKLLEVAKRLKLDINRVFLTHHHYDHVQEGEFIKARTGAKILAHEACERLLKGTVAVDSTLSDGETVKLQGGGVIRIIHTPGHSPGGICLVVDDQWLVTGDTLFVGDCGRTNLQGGDSLRLFSSLSLLKRLPDSLVVFPGHDYGPVPFRLLGEEKQLNPALNATTFKAFDALP